MQGQLDGGGLGDPWPSWLYNKKSHSFAIAHAHGIIMFCVVNTWYPYGQCTPWFNSAGITRKLLPYGQGAFSPQFFAFPGGGDHIGVYNAAEG